MKILVVDDDELIHLTLGQVFKGEEVHFAFNVQEAENLLSQHVFNCAFLDVQLTPGPVYDGIQLLRTLREKYNYLPCVMMSGLDDKELILKSLELGAVEFLVKGVVAPQAFKYATYKAAAWRKMVSDSAANRKGPGHIESQYEIRGASPEVAKLKESIKRLGAVDGPFLILGPTGSGKELVARGLWAAKGDPHRPFIAVNCASLPENLVESELFGYERGAFTGALSAKAGLFEAASGGDIFLDEIGELPTALQAKFLRVLQDRNIRRLGSHKERPVDVRVIAATNLDLKKAVVDGDFREDLFYRLNTHQIEVPALSKRKADIVLLLKFFLDSAGVQSIQIPDESRKQLENFEWPGNVRQLRAFAESLRPFLDDGNRVIESHFVTEWISRNTLRAHQTLGLGKENPQDLLREALNSKKSVNIIELVESLRAEYLKAALDLTGQNRTQAAKLLGVSRQRLSNWITELWPAMADEEL